MIKTEDIGSMPGIAGGLNKQVSMGSYTVKYYKANFDEPSDMLELQYIETKALHSKPGNEDVVLIDKDKFTFMDKYFIILKYLEKVA
jgi:hypothetical protein